jgi:hypothetical protein
LLRKITEADAEERIYQHQNASWHTWHIAVLSRAKKFPELKDFLGVETAKKKGLEEGDLKARLKAYQAQKEGRA